MKFLFGITKNLKPLMISKALIVYVLQIMVEEKMKKKDLLLF